MLLYQNFYTKKLKYSNYFHCIIKKHETVTNNPPRRIYVNKIENRITFKIKTDYHLELFTYKTIK